MTDRPDAVSQPTDLREAEARSERIRAEFSDTMGELRRRISPSTIRNDARNRVVHAGQDRFAQIRKLAMDNPLQAVAVGAGAAYPVFGLLRTIPAPFLLIGAGVAFVSRRGLARTSANGPASSAPGLPERVSAGVGDLAGTVSAAASRGTDRAGTLAADASRSVSDAATAVTDRVSALGAGTTKAAADLASAATDFVEGSYESGLRAATAAGDRLAASGRSTRDGVLEAVDRNPFVVAGLAALAGAAIAALLPSSRTESRLFGDTSDSVKRQAKATIDQGMDVAANAGERVLDDTLQAASEEGIGPEAARQAVQDVAEKAGAVVDKAFATATPNQPDTSNPSSNSSDPS